MFDSLKKFANDIVKQVDDKIKKIEVADPLLKRQQEKEQKRRQQMISSRSQKENMTLKEASA
jgi:short-subunit dehydrogenase involved in D-alanine esterification of teichoic acids